jgi:hypothetical protein
MQDKPIATPKLVTDIVFKMIKNRPVRLTGQVIIAADDTDDPKEHVVFSQLREPEKGLEMAENEKRKFRELPEGGQALFMAMLMAWVKIRLYGKGDDYNEEQPRRVSNDEDE